MCRTHLVGNLIHKLAAVLVCFGIKVELPQLARTFMDETDLGVVRPDIIDPPDFITGKPKRKRVK